MKNIDNFILWIYIFSAILIIIGVVVTIQEVKKMSFREPERPRLRYQMGNQMLNIFDNDSITITRITDDMRYDNIPAMKGIK